MVENVLVTFNNFLNKIRFNKTPNSFCCGILKPLTLPKCLFYTKLDINECLTNPCHDNANCSNTAGTFTCTCKVGFTGNGETCIGKYDSNVYNI